MALKATKPHLSNLPSRALPQTSLRRLTLSVLFSMTTSNQTTQWRIQDFPGGGGVSAPTHKSTIIFQSFCRKLHENERIWTEGRVPGAPLGSANATCTSLPGLLQ